MEYLKRLKSFGGKTLSLVIAPTLACNFACPYCYEANLPLSLMDEKVENGIIDFINSFSSRCDSLEICWEGGEPLLGIDKIKSLLERIETKSSLPLTYHSIITNGYLLSEEMLNYFKTKNLNFVQITIDGKEATHNKSRILKNGGNSYERIINNIDMVTRVMPDCLVVVRTNVHEGNKDEFGSIYKDFCMRWEGKKVRLFPAFVMPNSNCKVSCCTPQDKTDFFLNLKRKEDIQSINFIPRHNVGSCSATSENSYVIAPDGYLYKCWNDIGIKDRSVGNVFDGVTNNTLIAKYMVGSDKYSDTQCISCSLFPICDGGCNRHRLDNEGQDVKYPLCPFTEEGVADYLYEHYKSCVNK
ncbi:radical SAM/SPASM domain-containing protein [uncultured Muribaculum sp.]|nr:radical SAM protein [uncultured Muribaculum sp.]